MANVNTKKTKQQVSKEEQRKANERAQQMREFVRGFDDLAREKGIDKDIVRESIIDAVTAATVKTTGKNHIEPEINLDIDRGNMEILVAKEVFDPEDPMEKQTKTDLWAIRIDEAIVYKEDAQPGDILMIPIGLEEIGRQAVGVARQRFYERIKEAEKNVVFNKFSNEIGKIVSGEILKFDRKGYVVALGRTQAFLRREECVPGDNFQNGERIRALLLEIKEDKKGGLPHLVLTRTHPDFMKELFKAEIPEVFDGIIEVKGVARVPADRAKVAVYTTNPNLDPVGACIGMKGARINAISQELCGEKIDVIEWSPDTIEYICNAISPATVILTNIIEDDKTMEVVVPNDQLSLAIGKRGINVHLAYKLTGWRLDALSESEYSDIRAQRLAQREEEFKRHAALYNLDQIKSLTAVMISQLIEAGIDDIDKLSSTTLEEIMEILSIEHDDAVGIINEAIDHLERIEGIVDDEEVEEYDEESEESEEIEEAEEKE